MKKKKTITHEATKLTVREWIVKVVGFECEDMEKFKKDWESLHIEKRLSFIEKVLPYILPTAKKPDEVAGAAYNKEDSKFLDWQ